MVLAAIPIRLLVRVVLAEAGVVGLGLSAFLGHGIYSASTGRRTARRQARGATALQAVLTDGGSGEQPALPRRIWMDVLAGVAPRVVGAQRQRLTAMADHLGLLAHAEARCDSRLWWRRLQGARLFTLLGGGRATVPALLSDRRPEVRAQAAQWVVEHHDRRTVGLLLRMLDADDDSTRFAVKDSLIRIGRPVAQQLVDHLSGRSGPSIGPAVEVATALADPVFLPLALALCRADVGRIRALAAGLAGVIGGGPALDRLTDLLGDQAPEVRVAAVRALGQAGHWPAAAEISNLLSDLSWDVRQQAAVALRRLGSPGLLFLRRALSADDAFAADAAHWALDVPDSVWRTL